MKIHLVTYADKYYEKVSRLLLKEARRTHFFDSYCCYHPIDIRELTSKYWLARETRGGGYWMWKPYIILKEMERLEYGDAILYVDAGCSIHKCDEWSWYLDNIRQYDGIFFRYSLDEHYWFTPILKHWIKRSAVDYFSNFFPDNSWLEEPHFMAGVMMLKKTPDTIAVLKKWFKVMCDYPEFVNDVSDSEKHEQLPVFIENRHDQTILTSILLSCPFKDHFLFAKERSDSISNLGFKGEHVIVASRRSDAKIKNARRQFFLQTVKRILGEDNYLKIRGKFNNE